MEKTKEYQRRAAECRELSENALTAELRETYHAMALTWSKLAGERLEFEFTIPEDQRSDAGSGRP